LADFLGNIDPVMLAGYATAGYIEFTHTKNVEIATVVYFTAGQGTRV